MKLKKLTLVVLLFLTGLTTLLTIKKLLIAEQKWIEIQTLSMAGSWWWQSPAPPIWLSSPLKLGSQELNFAGKPIAKILKIESWSVPSDNSSSLRDYAAAKYLITAKIRVSQSPGSGKIWFKDNPVAVGQPIVLEINNTLINGNITWIENQSKAIIKKANVEMILYHRYPWEAKLIQNNPPLLIGGKEIFKINSVATSYSPLEWLEKGRLVYQKELVDINVKAIIETEIINNEPVFLKEQTIKTGKTLFVPLKNYELDGAKIKKIEWLD